MKRLDLTNPETLKKAASFPFYGQAESLIRTIDPLWKIDFSIPHLWSVRLEKDECDCNCPHCINVQVKRFEIEAGSPEDAEALAFERVPDPQNWEASDVKLSGKRNVPFPEWIYETEGAA